MAHGDELVASLIKRSEQWQARSDDTLPQMLVDASNKLGGMELCYPAELVVHAADAERMSTHHVYEWCARGSKRWSVSLDLPGTHCLWTRDAQ